MVGEKQECCNRCRQNLKQNIHIRANIKSDTQRISTKRISTKDNTYRWNSSTMVHSFDRSNYQMRRKPENRRNLIENNKKN